MATRHFPTAFLLPGLLLATLSSHAHASDWPMFHHDARRTGVSTSEMPAPGNMELLWTHTVRSTGIGGAPIHSSPSIVDGRVYFVARNRRIHCLDAEDGSMIWSKSLGWAWSFGDEFGSNWVDSSPCVVGGTVFVGARNGLLHAFDAETGSNAWPIETPVRFLGAPILSSPSYNEGALFVASQDGWMWIINPLDGSDRCPPLFLELEQIYNSPTTISGWKNLIGVGQDDESGPIYTADWAGGSLASPECATGGGALLPLHNTGCWVRSTAVVTDSTIYQGDGSAGWPRGLTAMNHDGTVKWSIQSGFGEWTCATPAVDDDRIYMPRGQTGPDLVCLTDQGTSPQFEWGWSAVPDSSAQLRGLQCSPAVADGLVFMAATLSSTGNPCKLYCLDADTGQELKSWGLGQGDLFSSPAIADGKVYIGSPSGTLFCFGDPNAGQ